MTLRPAGDSGAHFVSARLFGTVEGEILYQQRTGTDEGHVAFQHVPELRKFIDGSGAYETSHLSQTLSIREEIAVGVALVGHSLELDYLEDLAVLAGSFLEEECPCALVSEMQPEGNGCQR